jgi:hypothetical protein
MYLSAAAPTHYAGLQIKFMKGYEWLIFGIHNCVIGCICMVMATQTSSSLTIFYGIPAFRPLLHC